MSVKKNLLKELSGEMGKEVAKEFGKELGKRVPFLIDTSKTAATWITEKVGNTIKSVIKNEDRNKLYSEIKKVVFNNPYQFKRHEIIQHIREVDYFATMALELSPKPYFYLIPIYGQYKLLNDEFKKWDKLRIQLGKLLEKRDYEEYHELYRTKKIESEYFSFYPEIMEHFLEICEKKDIYYVACYINRATGGLDRAMEKWKKVDDKNKETLEDILEKEIEYEVVKLKQYFPARIE
ncbi:hypothetical protein M3936_12680 [Sutcliffiella horikoshii]|uniref:hypothetical protein n=1 Tax=Sutcliffiella horikoshii TaxID=79883 RepID=UPI00203B87F4|nr:hypothetical protein [Sutcliffiella horikoshii]MCM3618437.1 hypothetical protein [Sutcliffiella horikoshii]